MNPLDLARLAGAPPWAVLLLKITAVLIVAWLAHWALTRANPRWRVLLWRVVAIALIALPAVAILPPALKIRVARPAALVDDGQDSAAKRADETLANPPPVIGANRRVGQATGHPRSGSASEGPPSSGVTERRRKPVERVGAERTAGEPETAAVQRQAQPPQPAETKAAAVGFPWFAAVLTAWLCGIAVLFARLAVGHYRLRQVVCQAAPPPEWIAAEFTKAASAHRLQYAGGVA